MAPALTSQMQLKSWWTGFWERSANFHSLWWATTPLVLPSSIVWIRNPLPFTGLTQPIKAKISLTAAWIMPSLICLSCNKYKIILSLAATPLPSGNFRRRKVNFPTLLMQSFGSVVLNAWINAQVLSSILILAIFSCCREKCFFFSAFLSLLIACSALTATSCSGWLCWLNHTLMWERVHQDIHYRSWYTFGGTKG